MATLISSVIEQILEEQGIVRNVEAEHEARKMIERSKRQKRLETQFRDWEEAA